MLFTDKYFEIKKTSTATLKERGSKFISIAIPVYSENELKLQLQYIRAQYPDATHHCYAAILGIDKHYQKSADDGEPSGSAGRPILRTILSHELTNVLVVVVRYFGGTLLGIPGLIEAYSSSAKEAIKSAEIIEKYVCERIDISCSFEHENEIYRLLKNFHHTIIKTEYSETVSIVCIIKIGDVFQFENQIKKLYMLQYKNLGIFVQ